MDNLTNMTNITNPDDGGDDRRTTVLYYYLAAVDIVAFVGLLGNVFLFCLMFQSALRHVSFSVYLTYLSVIQSLVLLQTATEDTLDHGFDVLDQFLEPICRPWLLLMDTTRFASTWLVFALTIDRCVAIFMTKYKDRYCSRKISHIICLSIIGVCFILSLPPNVAPRISNNATGEYNNDDPPGCPNDLFLYITITSGIFHTLLPVLLCCVLDIIILVKVKRAVQRVAVNDESQTRAINVTQAERVKWCLVALCCLAILTLFPIAVVETIENFSKNETAVENAGKAWRFFNVLLLVNYGQNFYIIIAMSLYMRCLFHQMICGKKALYRKPDEFDTILSASENNFL